MRLHVDNNEQHLLCYGPDSSTSFAHPSVMHPRENIVDVEEEVHNLLCQHHFLVIVVSREFLILFHGNLLLLPLTLHRHMYIAVSTQSAIASKSCFDEMLSVSSKNSSENLLTPSMT